MCAATMGETALHQQDGTSSDHVSSSPFDCCRSACHKPIQARKCVCAYTDKEREIHPSCLMLLIGRSQTRKKKPITLVRRRYHTKLYRQASRVSPLLLLLSLLLLLFLFVIGVSPPTAIHDHPVSNSNHTTTDANCLLVVVATWRYPRGRYPIDVQLLPPDPAARWLLQSNRGWVLASTNTRHDDDITRHPYICKYVMLVMCVVMNGVV